MKHFLGFTLVGLTVLGMGWVWADEKTELRKRAIAQQEAAERRAREAERERREQTDQRHREAIEREQLARRQLEKQKIAAVLQELQLKKERLTKVLGASHPSIREVEQQILTLEKQLAERGDDLHRPNPRDKMAEKIEHLHAAAEHLHQAGMPDMARELHERAEMMERELNRHREEPADDRRLDEVMEVVEDLRREMERLRDEVSELKEQLRKD